MSESLTNKLPELVYKLVLSIPLYYGHTFAFHVNQIFPGRVFGHHSLQSTGNHDLKISNKPVTARIDSLAKYQQKDYIIMSVYIQCDDKISSTLRAPIFT